MASAFLLKVAFVRYEDVLSAWRAYDAQSYRALRWDGKADSFQDAAEFSKQEHAEKFARAHGWTVRDRV